MLVRPTYGEVRDALNYDGESGLFTWRARRTTAVMAGDTAGCLTKDGYVYIKLKRQSMYAHRLAWLYVNGSWPLQKIDHRDGDKTNNRISNLREVSVAENTQNQVHARKTASGLLGVCWNKACKKWQAQIGASGATTYLGLFVTREAAYDAYCQAKQLIHPSAPDRRAL